MYYYYVVIFYILVLLVLVGLASSVSISSLSTRIRWGVLELRAV